MDSVNYEIIKQVNRDIIKAQNKEELLLDRLEKLSNSAKIKYLNFKVIGIASLLFFLIGGIIGYSLGTKPIIIKEGTQIFYGKDAKIEEMINSKGHYIGFH